MSRYFLQPLARKLANDVGAFRHEVAPCPRAGIDHAGALLGNGEGRQPGQCGLVQPLRPFVFGEI